MPQSLYGISNMASCDGSNAARLIAQFIHHGEAETRAMNAKASVADLIAQFICQGEGKSQAWRKLDVKTFNKHADGIARIVKELKGQSPSKLAELIPLMKDEDPYVRLSAAYHCLDIDREEAIRVIRKLAQTGNIARVNAFTILRYIGEG
jgi:hypothetical protein